jgi:phosphoglycerate dehydrogenase-like enzyme
MKRHAVRSHSDQIDVATTAYLRDHGISLTTAAEVNAHNVADHAVALLFGWWHGLAIADRSVRNGRWRENLMPRRSLRSRCVGIVVSAGLAMPPRNVLWGTK